VGSTGLAVRILDQRVVRTAFDNLAFVHHDDAVGVAHGAQAVRNDEHGAPLQMCVMLSLEDGSDS
jgi:hypothetical protein